MRSKIVSPIFFSPVLDVCVLGPARWTVKVQCRREARDQARASVRQHAEACQTGRADRPDPQEGRGAGRGIVEIRTLHTTNGDWDLVADIRAASLSEFDHALRQVRMIEAVLNSETSLLLSTV
ncbi:Lrp/AsnC ligand binding domain-containing protein [Sphingomonas sp. PL-96]|nr:Lrp/AsnC ligand binding domain-containing protein [Sphingomonas sp. PL-96]